MVPDWQDLSAFKLSDEHDSQPPKQNHFWMKVVLNKEAV